MPLRLLNSPKKAYETEAPSPKSYTRGAEAHFRQKWDFGAYKVHPLDDPDDPDPIKIKVGSLMWRGTTTDFLDAQGLHAHPPGGHGEHTENRIYVSETETDAGGYGHITQEVHGGKPIVCRIVLDQYLFSKLKPGYEGLGEWYIDSEFIPRVAFKCMNVVETPTGDYRGVGKAFEKELESYDALVEGLDDGTLKPFRGYDLTMPNGEKWHYWVEEWSSLCTEEYFDEKRVKKDKSGEPIEESLDAEERRALDTALDLFANDLVKDAPGRAPDEEDWLDTEGIYGYQILGWKERPGEKWSRWVRRSSVRFPGITPFRQMCRVLPPERVVP